MDHTQELGTERIGKLFLKYAIPSVIGMLFFSVYIVIDGIFVGQTVGGQALAAINIALPFFSIAMAISIMLSAGATTIVAIELGQGEPEKARKTFSLAFYTLLILSTTVSILTLTFLTPISKALGATPELLPLVTRYLGTLCFFTPIFTTSGLLSSGIRVMGRPGYSMICTITGSIFNIVFDYFMVVKWGMGVEGAALASGVAFGLSFFLGFFPYLKKSCILRFSKCIVDFKKIGKFFYNGSSEALTEVAVAYSTYLFNMVLLSRMGEMGVSAFSIISYVTSLIIAVFLGISTGIAPLISFNYGAQNTDRVISINKLGIKIMALLGVLCTLLLWVFSRPMINLFAPGDTILIDMTVQATQLYSFAFLFNGINILGASYFTALEDAKTSALISFMRGILFITVGIFILPMFIGDSGIWLSIAFSEIITLIFTFILFKRSYNKLYIMKSDISKTLDTF
ncbi:MAG: MATE family efflux transporter [Cellulosilyticaceae bacterium]